MLKKIIAGVVIGLSAVLFLASAAGLGAVWYYNTPLTETALSQLAEVDSELARAETALGSARVELERTLRIIDSAEVALSALKEEVDLARQLFGEVDETLDSQLVPALRGARSRVDDVKRAIEDLRGSLEALNAIPFVNLNLPGDQLLVNLLAVASAIDGEIVRVEDLAQKAATFAKDASYLMGGDLGETRQNLQGLLVVVTDYQQKVTGWRAQVAVWTESMPGWIDTAALILTVFLLWFGLANLGMLVHGLNAWRGGDPWAVLRRSAAAREPGA